jgi:uncharacterized protein YjbI with pentapeptide repeats
MIGRYSFTTIGLVVLIFFVAIAIAGLVWFLFPSWLSKKLGANKTKESLDVEDGYRKAMSQVLGLPLAVFGVVGAFFTVAEGINAYNKAVLADFQDRYRRGFDMLASTEAGTRIGGLYVLEGLIEQNIEATAGKDAKHIGIQQNTILQSIAAFAVDHSALRRPGGDDPVIAQDALVALRIIGKFNTDNAELPVNLRGGYFYGSLIPNANLNHVNLYGANFGGADLYRGHLFEANLRDVSFDGANLTDVDLSHAGFLNTTFCSARNFATASLMKDAAVSPQMNNTKFYSAWGLRVYFKGAEMMEAIFNNATFTDVSFAAAHLAGAQFRAIKLDGADFTNAQMDRTNFGRDVVAATILNAKFNDADLSLGKFDDAQMPKAAFRNSNLRGASFVNANLSGADFSGANLTDVDFEGAMMSKASFEGAILRRTNFKGTVFDRQLPPGGHPCNNATGDPGAGDTICAKSDFAISERAPLSQHCAVSPLVRQQNPPK